jgi:predicted phage terminase large subunit-like protein
LRTKARTDDLFSRVAAPAAAPVAHIKVPAAKLRPARDRDADETALRRKLRGSLRNWAEYALPPGHVPAAHHRMLIDALVDVRLGITDRLMVLMPPGSAKSTYGSVVFPAWWMALQPRASVIACAHTASLAEEFGGRVRGLLAEHGPILGAPLDGRRARGDFRTAGGGAYFAAGVQGAITGRRADLILIDDPVKSFEHADSPPRRDHLWNWYRSDLTTRLKPGGRVVLIMTRWHEDDLGGRLLEHEPDWRCIRLPALAEENDPLGREPGAPLWPEWESAAQLDRKRTSIGERGWAALFQQTPRPQGNLLFAMQQIAITDTPAPIVAARGWDLAATSQVGKADPDWTVGLKIGCEASGRLVVMDVVRLRGGPHEVESAILQTAQRDGLGTPISLPQDPGQAGKMQAQYLVGRLAGYRASSSPETGSKLTRASPIASQIAAGNVALARAPWNAVLLDELANFPGGRKDDQVDALSRAYAALTNTGAPARSMFIGLTAR